MITRHLVPYRSLYAPARACVKHSEGVVVGRLPADAASPAHSSLGFQMVPHGEVLLPRLEWALRRFQGSTAGRPSRAAYGRGCAPRAAPYETKTSHASARSCETTSTSTGNTPSLL